jgi:hypothetical protein
MQSRQLGKPHAVASVHGLQPQCLLPGSAITSAAAVRQHTAVAKSAAVGGLACPSQAKPWTHSKVADSVHTTNSKLLVPSAASVLSCDLPCSEDVAQHAQHAGTAELALLQELVQDAQQLQELLNRHPEVLQAQHPSPLQAWVRAGWPKLPTTVSNCDEGCMHAGSKLAWSACSACVCSPAAATLDI